MPQPWSNRLQATRLPPPRRHRAVPLPRWSRGLPKNAAAPIFWSHDETGDARTCPPPHKQAGITLDHPAGTLAGEDRKLCCPCKEPSAEIVIFLLCVAITSELVHSLSVQSTRAARCWRARCRRTFVRLGSARDPRRVPCTLESTASCSPTLRSSNLAATASARRRDSTMEAGSPSAGGSKSAVASTRLWRRHSATTSCQATTVVHRTSPSRPPSTGTGRQRARTAAV